MSTRHPGYTVQPHCWTSEAGEAPRVVEWRVVRNPGPANPGGMLVMVTRDQAEAHLLAAAPALLDAARYVLACIEHGDVSYTQPVQDAISKASGA